MKVVIFSAALMILLGRTVYAEDVISEKIPRVAVRNILDEPEEYIALDETEDINVFSPFDYSNPSDRGGSADRFRRGADRRRRGGDRGRNGERGGVSWTCVAKDRGWEEHSGGHKGFGRNQYEAADTAMYICRLSHSQCFISTCRLD